MQHGHQPRIGKDARRLETAVHLAPHGGQHRKHEQRQYARGSHAAAEPERKGGRKRGIALAVQIRFKPHGIGQLHKHLNVLLVGALRNQQRVVAIARDFFRVEVVVVNLLAVETDLHGREVGDDRKYLARIGRADGLAQIEVFSAHAAFGKYGVLCIVDAQLARSTAPSLSV